MKQPLRDPSEIERWLSTHIAARVKVADIDPKRPLHEYGLDSLSAVRLLSKLEDWLGEKLPETLFFDYPDIRTLSQAIASRQFVPPEEYVAPDEDCYPTRLP